MLITDVKAVSKQYQRVQRLSISRSNACSTLLQRRTPVLAGRPKAGAIYFGIPKAREPAQNRTVLIYPNGDAMCKNTMRLEIVASDLESRYGPQDDDVVELKQEIAKRLAMLSMLAPKFPQERRASQASPNRRLDAASRQGPPHSV